MPTEAEIEAFRAAMPLWWQSGEAQRDEDTKRIRACLEAAERARTNAPAAELRERCARVAELWSSPYGEARDVEVKQAIAAAIRNGE